MVADEAGPCDDILREEPQEEPRRGQERVLDDELLIVPEEGT